MNINHKEEINNMQIERRIFFIAISSILTAYENEPFFCRETIREENWGSDTEEDIYETVVYRTYSIEKPAEAILKHEFVSCKKGSNRYRNYFADKLDKYIPYSEMEPYFDLLIDNYPYLAEYIKRLLEKCYENYNELSLVDAIEIEQEYLSNKMTKKITKK